MSLLFKTPIIPGETLLFFDEVQEAPRAILALRYFYEEMPGLHVIAAGSLLEFAIAKVGVPVGRSGWFLRPLECFENRGEIAEGFIGQELICYASPDSKAEIHFWKRKEKNSSAEVDYLIQRGELILPIEVKSGQVSTLRSLHLFLDTHLKSTSAIRFSSLNYSLINKLDSRPLYAVASVAHESQKEALGVGQE